MTINPVTLPAATVGTPYSASFSASGGTGGYTWWTSGLPPGLAFTSSNGTATISGTPTKYGLFWATVSAHDSADDGAGFNQYLVVS
ncbi:MAG TPA: putative Ig domain-containing protein [Spirochaetia bacterium]|nr:putative Ig domain-containing protein [Spirochaetia bacterium]